MPAFWDAHGTAFSPVRQFAALGSELGWAQLRNPKNHESRTTGIGIAISYKSSNIQVS